MEQIWNGLLFAHWPIKAEALRGLIPSFLEIDQFDGTAWIGVVPFGMTAVRFRHLPAVPFMSAFPELNVRTYVRWKEKSGVYFFSLDAANPVAVEVARAWFCLPYYHARMSSQISGDGIRYHSKRTDKRGRAAEFEAEYAPASAPILSIPGTVEYWLTERYCFLTASRAGDIAIGEVHHRQWPLQKAKARITKNTMLNALGLEQPDSPPLLHFSRKLETIEWAIFSPR
jgi:hypothetical protein